MEDEFGDMGPPPGFDTSGRRPGSYEVEIERLKDTISNLTATVRVREATIQMACDRLGGLVEGHPTNPLNFLQRIDQLVALERQLVVVSVPAKAEPQIPPEYDEPTVTWGDHLLGLTNNRWIGAARQDGVL